MQRLIFTAAPGLMIQCYLVPLASPYASVEGQLATEYENDLGRYVVEFADTYVGRFRLSGYVGTQPGFVNENYYLEGVVRDYLPQSELFERELVFGARNAVLGSTDWQQVRYRLGLDGPNSAPANPVCELFLSENGRSELSNQIWTDLSSGENSANAGLEAIGVDVTSRILLDPNNRLLTDAAGRITLNASQATDLFSDADVAELVNSIIDKFDGASELPIQTIASAVKTALFHTTSQFNKLVVLANGSVGANVQTIEDGIINDATISTDGLNAIKSGLATTAQLTAATSPLATSTQLTTSTGSILGSLTSVGANVATLLDYFPAPIRNMLTSLVSMISLNRFTVDSLTNLEIPAQSVTILPGVVRQSELQRGSRLRAYTGQRSPIMASVYDSAEQPIDLTGRTLEFRAELNGKRIATIADASIEVTGVDLNTFYFDPPDALVSIAQLCQWSLRDASDVLGSGELEVIFAP